jgi:predicted oxidoreductase
MALLAEQAAIHASLRTHAAELGHDMAKVEPIYAVVDVRAWRGKRLLRVPHAAAMIPPGQ